MRRRAALRRIATTLALGLGASACGYAFVDDGDAPRRKVAVAVVDNRSFRQRLEIPLTRRLLEQLPVIGPYSPAALGEADAELRVQLVDVAGRSVSGSGLTPVREGALDFAVVVRLVDLASGAVLRERRIVDRAEFRIAVGETEASAVEEAAYDLARKIVLALDEDF
ncbi:MAG: hypothetical protein HZB39_11380 [Planctomycetes bacterium]|nr:hypothetical protein [Planctomycetota bacterium]